LLGFLETDPANPRLLTDAAEAAMADRRYGVVRDLVARYAEVVDPPAPLVNLGGLAAMHEGRFDDALAAFSRCVKADPDQPTPRYNLAWALSAKGEWADAAALLDDSVTTSTPGAAVLKVRALHQLGQMDDALAWGAEFLTRHPGEPALFGALSAAAMDAENPPLAAEYAQRAGEAPEGLATLGLLRLDAGERRQAEQAFDRALRTNPDCARALLGKGLARLADGDGAAAAAELDRVATLYGTHLGSWIAAGWAHFIAGDLDRARQRFETAARIDGAFAEAHGALAVIDLFQERVEDARRRAQVAMRLDRASFAGVLATSLLMDSRGETETAERLRSAALNTPVGASGQTIAQMAARLAANRR